MEATSFVDKMKFKETFYLACLLVGIATYYFGIEKPAEKEKISQQEFSSNVLPFKKDDVQKIELKGKDSSILLAKAMSENWYLQEPIEAKGDLDAIRLLLERMESLQFSRIVDETPKDTELFGLKSPFLKMTLFLSDNNKKIINFGDIHPMGSGFYISTNERDRVLLSNDSRDDFVKSVYELRDKTVLTFDDKKLKKIKITGEDKTVQLEKNSEGWALIQKEKLKADPSAVQHLINNLRFQKVKQFIDASDESANSMGLISPYLTVTLEQEDVVNPLLLIVGDKSEAHGRYAQTNLSDQIFILSSADIADLALDSVNLLDKTLVTVPSADISQIEFQDRESVIRLQRSSNEENTWQIIFPIESRADVLTMNSLLADLREARILNFAQTTIEDPKLFGFDPPKRILKIKSGQKDWTLELGNQSLDKEMYYARRAGESAVFNLSTSLVEKLFRSLHDLRDRKLLNFETDAVHRIRWEFPHQTLELVQNGKFWTLEKPEKIEKIRSFLGNEVLWTLKTIEYDQKVDSPPASSWVNSPAVKLEIWDEKETLIATLKMGGPEDEQGRVFAQVNNDPQIYRVSKRFLQELPSSPDKFR